MKEKIFLIILVICFISCSKENEAMIPDQQETSSQTRSHYSQPCTLIHDLSLNGIGLPNEVTVSRITNINARVRIRNIGTTSVPKDILFWLIPHGSYWNTNNWNQVKEKSTLLQRIRGRGFPSVQTSGGIEFYDYSFSIPIEITPGKWDITVEITDNSFYPCPSYPADVNIPTLLGYPLTINLE